MMIIKRKQIIVVAVALLLLLAGVVQIIFGGRNTDIPSQGDKTDNTEVVDKTPDNSSSLILDDVVSDSDSNSDANPEVDAGADISTPSDKGFENFFAYEKTERQSLREDRQEALNSITESQTADEASKTQAYTSLMELVALTEKEQSLENMIIGCGYDDCIVYFFEDGTIDVYVAATEMSGVEATKIADIVARNSATTLNKVYVKTKF